jgi:hypothetical protein
MIETSDEGLRLYSIVRRLVKGKKMVVLKYWLGQRYVPIVVKLCFCVARYVRPKSVEKGRSATAQCKMRKREVVNTLIKHGIESNAQIKGRTGKVRECTVE